MYPKELKIVFDKAVKDSIEQIPVISLAFKGELDLKSPLDNERDFYLGVVIATIFEIMRFMARWQDLQNNR